uniref:Uncharacterized protein n=1 Tax=Arundo donax TaxID=35708 RepID=A0A0A9ARK9_ARUDO
MAQITEVTCNNLDKFGSKQFN